MRVRRASRSRSSAQVSAGAGRARRRQTAGAQVRKLGNRCLLGLHFGLPLACRLARKFTCAAAAAAAERMRSHARREGQTNGQVRALGQQRRARALSSVAKSISLSAPEGLGAVRRQWRQTQPTRRQAPLAHTCAALGAHIGASRPLRRLRRRPVNTKREISRPHNAAETMGRA